MGAFAWIRQFVSPRPDKRSKSKRWDRESLAPHLHVKRLEERRVLNADAAPVQQLVIDAGSAAADGQADTYVVEQHDNYVHVSVNGQEVGRASLAQLDSIHIRGSLDDDILIAEFKSGEPLAGLDLLFDGGGGVDTLSLNGDIAANDVTHEFGDAGFNRVGIESIVGLSTISYVGVETVHDQLTAENRTFRFESGGQQIALSDFGTPDDDLSRLLTNDSAQHNEISVVFKNPTRALGIDTSTSVERADSVELAGLDDNFRADLSVLGSPDDLFTVRGPTDLGGGDLEVLTGTIRVEDSLTTNDATITFQAEEEVFIGENGSVQNDGGNIVVEAPSIIHDGAIWSHGGQVHLDSGAAGTTIVRGVIDVSADIGQSSGTVHVLGFHVGLLDNAQINASAAVAAGTVLIGGDYQGKNPEIRNAARTYVAPDVVIRADANVAGDGGKVVVWADEITRFYGTISARGGSDGGDGGFAEVSGNEHLEYRGMVDLTASNGGAGQLLLDPTVLNIVAAGLDDLLIATFNVFNPVPATATISSTLPGILGNLILRATSTINIEASIVPALAITGLVLDAPSINFVNGADITLIGADLTLRNDVIVNGVADVRLDGTVQITTGGGDVNFERASISGNAIGLDNLTINTSTAVLLQDGGDVTLRAFDDLGGQFVNNVTIAAAGGLGGNNGDIGVSGDVSVLGALQVTIANDASFDGSVSVSSLLVAAAVNDFSLNGATNAIDTATTFLNTGTLTLGDEATDTTTFTNGVTATAPSGINIAGTIAANNGASTITLGDANTGVTVTANTTVGGTATGLIDLGDVTINDGFLLSLGTGIGNAINLDAISGVAAGAASNLEVDTTGVVTVAEAVGTDIGTITITQSGGVTFQGTVDATTVDIQDTTGTVAFEQNTTITTLTTAAQGYNVAFTGTTTTVTNAATFLNTGTVTLGNNAADVVLFHGGANIPLANIFGIVRSSADLLDFGDLTLLGNSILDTTNNGANTAGAAIDISTITGNAFTLDLNSGTAGAITVGGAVDDVATLTIVQSNGATFQGTVGVGTPGAVTITDTQDVQSVAFEQNTTITTLTTAAQGYNVAFTGTTTNVTTNTTFLNTGTVTLGNGAGDTTTFTNGVTATAPSGINIAGTIAANNGVSTITLGDANTGVTVTANATVGGTATGLIDLGDAILNDGVTLTVGTGIANAINLDAISGVAAGAASNLEVDTTGVVTVAEAVGTDIGTITITQSGGVAFQGTVNATTVDIQDTTGTVAFEQNTTITTLITTALGYSVAFTGTTTNVTNDTTFLNTGTVTLGNGAGDTTTFTNGVTATAPSGINIAGTIAANAGASTITLGDANTGVTVTANTTVGGTATGLIDLGDAILNNGVTLTVGTGIANTINLDAISGVAAGAASNLEVDTTGVVTVAEAVGTDIGTITITQSGGVAFQGTVNATTVDIQDTTGTVAFEQNTTITTLTTAAQGYNVAFTGTTTTVTNAATFLNTGTLTLGDAATDTTTFTNGVTATAPSGINIAGTIAANNGASTITLGDANTGVTVTANTTVGGTATGLIDLGDAVLNNGVTLVVGTGIANAINLDAISGVALGLVSDLVIDTTGLVTVSGAVGTDIGTITITQSGGAAFQGTVDVATVDIQDTTGTVAFQQNTTITTLTTAAQGYNVAFTGTTTNVTTNTTFLNTGTVTLGNGAGDTTTFTNGVTATAPSGINIAGTIAANNGVSTITLGDANTGVTVTANATVGGTATGLIDLGDAILNDGVTLTVGTGIANAINLDAISGVAAGAASNLEVDTTGVVTVAEAVGTDIGTITITQSGGVAFQGTVNATTVDIQDTTGTVAFEQNTTITTLITTALGYSVAFTGTTTNVTNDTTFLNTGTVTLGNGAGDTTTFTNGVTATAPSGINIAGTIAANAGASTITLGDANTGVTVTANTTVGGTATGLIDLGDAILNNGVTLTVGTGIANTINLDAISGVAAGAASNLEVDTTGVVTVAEAVGTDIGTITITQSGGVAFQGTVNATTVDIQDTTGTVAFEQNTTITTLITTALGYSVAFTGTTTNVTTNTTFLNTGTVTLGNGAGDATTFTNGVTATAPSGINIAGTIAANNGVSTITLGDANTGVTVTANATVGGTATGLIDLGDAILNDGVTLTVGTGIANAINLDAISGVAAGAASNLEVDTTGVVTVAEAVGTDIGTITITQSGGVAFQGTVNATTVDIQDTTGTVAFEQNTTITTLITTALGYSVAFTGTTTNVTNDTTFLNTGTVTLGNGAGDTTTFTGGLDTTAATLTNVAGTVATVNTAMDLGAAAMLDSTTLKSSGGAINLVSTAVPVIGLDLTINSSNTAAAANGGAIALGTFTGQFINDLIIDSRGGVGGVAGTIPLGFDLLVDDNGAGDLGSIALSGDVRLTADVLIDTEQGNTAAGGPITLNGAINADNAVTNDRTLTLDALASGIISVNSIVGAVQPLAGLTIVNSAGATFTASVSVTDGAGTITISDTVGTVNFQDNLLAGTLATANKPYHVEIRGTTNTIETQTTFLNTGTVTLGDGTGDTTTFQNGVTATAPSAVNIAGIVAASVGASTITLGDVDTEVTITDNARVGGAATGLIDLGDAIINNGLTLTVGTGINNAINLDAVNADVIGNAILIVNTLGVVTVAEAVGAIKALGEFTIDAGSMVLQGNVTATTLVDLQATSTITLNTIQVSATGATGMITFEVPTLAGFQFTDVLFVASGGQISEAALDPAVLANSDVLVPAPGGGLTNSNRTATIEVHVTDPDGTNFEVAADWLDGVIDLETVDGEPAVSEITHIYGSNPTGNPAADIPMVVRLTSYANNTIQPRVGGSLLVAEETLVIDVLSLPIALSALPASPLPANPAAPPAAVGNIEPAAAPGQRVTIQFAASSAGVGSEAEVRYYELRIVSFDADGNLIELKGEQDIIDLNDEKLKAIAPFNLSKLPALFGRLPADRYRIYLIEDGTERLILEFTIEQGQPIEIPEINEIEPAAGEGAVDPPINDAAEIQNLDGIQIANSDEAIPGATPVRFDARQPNLGSHAAETFAERLGNASFISHGGVVIGAAAVAYATGDRWEKSIDRLMERFDHRRRQSAWRRRTKSESRSSDAAARDPIHVSL